MEQNIDKFFILGTPGSGKTTLAQKLNEKFGHPHHNLDDYLYDENGLIPDNRRIQNAERLAAEPNWIAEGNFLYWTGPLLESADHIVWLKTPIIVATYRIMKRDTVTRI